MADSISKERVIRFCDLSNRFVLQLFTQGEWLCLHCDEVATERLEMSDFIKSEATVVEFVKENGRKVSLPLKDFEYVPEEGYLEHKSRNVIINLHKNKYRSYTYTNDRSGEITDISPIQNVIIA